MTLHTCHIVRLFPEILTSLKKIGALPLPEIMAPVVSVDKCQREKKNPREVLNNCFFTPNLCSQKGYMRYVQK